jgi:hypothetical protein
VKAGDIEGLKRVVVSQADTTLKGKGRDDRSSVGFDEPQLAEGNAVASLPVCHLNFSNRIHQRLFVRSTYSSLTFDKEVTASNETRDDNMGSVGEESTIGGIVHLLRDSQVQVSWTGHDLDS